VGRSPKIDDTRVEPMRDKGGEASCRSELLMEDKRLLFAKYLHERHLIRDQGDFARSEGQRAIEQVN
jgi:hypothetical protein